MYPFVSLKESMANDVIKRAKNLAWDSFSKEEQEVFLKKAKEDQDAYSTALAIKCLKEAEDAFNEPGFISRADPRAYSDYKEPIKAGLKDIEAGRTEEHSVVAKRLRKKHGKK